ncbi:hypothetical protein [Pseudotabrizicola sp.]|uniref:hypothetical protein n=1 Tax=Pseudotabrizicola sp. TaxID=2939647 RepID=UPI00272EEF87|nr:hypothetical protein [Pseudotabrizicola sp.]MDP2081191.1 hypothetical protein [Pseudotabrizicola sp.]
MVLPLQSMRLAFPTGGLYQQAAPRGSGGEVTITCGLALATVLTMVVVQVLYALLFGFRPDPDRVPLPT